MKIKKLKINPTPKLNKNLTAKKIVNEALGVHPSFAPSKFMLGKLLNHPDKQVAKAAKSLMGDE